MYYSELRRAWIELIAPGAPFEIVDTTIRGVPSKIFKQAPLNIREFWLATAQFAEREYIIYGDERLTYQQAHERVNALSNWLVGTGIRSGERVAIAMRNYPEWILIYWACVSIGVTVVGMNAWWTTAELEFAIKDSKPRAIFCDGERFHRIAAGPRPSFPFLIVTTRMEASPSGAIRLCDILDGGGAMPDVEIGADADACIFYTSGTTGFPKGALLTHRSCMSNMMNISFFGQAQALAMQYAGSAIPEVGSVVPLPVTLVPTPLFHVTAANAGMYPCTNNGGKIVLMYRWDAEEALRLIENEGVTTMSGVPTMVREILTHPDFDQFDTSSLAVFGGGGAAILPDLVEKIEGRMKAARAMTGYGLTETSGVVTVVAADFFVGKPTSVGPVMPSLEACCVDENGEPVGTDELGELWVRGSPIIKEYINRPDETAATITDGWLHTGDIARIDNDGFLFLVDRAKDMVLRGGENVFCVEVEASVYRHGSVKECCVFGVLDERLGEEVGAAIVLHDDRPTTAEELRLHCAELLAKYKIPRYIWFLSEPIPRNASGKFLKRDLRMSLKLEDAS